MAGTGSPTALTLGTCPTLVVAGAGRARDRVVPAWAANNVPSQLGRMVIGGIDTRVAGGANVGVGAMVGVMVAVGNVVAVVMTVVVAVAVGTIAVARAVLVLTLTVGESGMTV